MESPIIKSINEARDPSHLRMILTEANQLNPSGKTRRQWLRAANEKRKACGWSEDKLPTTPRNWARKTPRTRKPRLALPKHTTKIDDKPKCAHPRGMFGKPSRKRHPVKHTVVTDPRFMSRAARERLAAHDRDPLLPGQHIQ